ncbi:hypothetical protein BMS3Abin17_00042 [archaeon BMS3Abin17]|nr:hypothetical protein BMS3Abin17_00042 [archaeon BMS3Abin17]
MKLINYIGLNVKINLKNNYYYICKVISADKESIDIIDKKGKNISISKYLISTIEEI